jgi:hypothetical protein
VANELCCSGEEVLVTRVILAFLDEKQNVDHLRGVPAKGQNLIDFKALSRRNGNSRRKVSSSYIDDGIKIKANTLRQIGSTALSTIVPGDMGPLRSPVRSAVYRTITPGFGGRRGGSRPGQNRAARCPEGYQYGGRFTDNRLSTCGAQLFDIPSALGTAIGAARSAIRTSMPQTTTAAPITGAQIGSSSIIQSRAAQIQIPRVANGNSSLSASGLKNMVGEIGEYNRKWNLKVRRMVRRDGFVLEPVVPNKVLRAIPDNRDMEGAYFIMSALSPQDIGGEELGLLSNTGVRSLVYVLPGGSTLTLEKARKLEIGERRKLGRVVNTAQEINNSSDPAARLKNVASEIGDGLSFSEDFKGVKNPNERVGNSLRWAKELWSGKKKDPSAPSKEVSSSRETETFSARRKLIKNLDEAIEMLSSGGSLSAVDPSIMPKVLQNVTLVRRQKLAKNISTVASPNGKFFLYESPEKHQHLAERFASDVQQFLGMESPDVLFAGKPGDKRQYLRQDVESAIPGGVFNPNVRFEDLDVSDVARMMISDFLTDQRERPATSIYPIETPEGPRAVLAQNTTSGLIDLSKIEITKRTKMSIEQFYAEEGKPSYSEYYQALKAEQRLLFMRLIAQLIDRARKFKPEKYSDNLDMYGLSTGEKIHLNIIGKLFESRLEILSNQKDVLRSIVRG